MSTQFSAQRRYVLRQEFLRDYCHRRRSRARACQPRRTIHCVDQPSDLSLAKIVAPENLLAVFKHLRAKAGRAPGVDGVKYENFSLSEMAGVLRKVSRAIHGRRYVPYPTRTVWVPKSHGGVRELRLPTVVDRIVAKALGHALTYGFDGIFLPGVYGFRPQRDVWDMLLAMERTGIMQDRWVIAQDDIRDAFPRVPVADALADYARWITDSDLLSFIQTVLQGDERQARTVGIAQGNAASPITLNLRLHHALDLPFSAAGLGNPPWYRYADDLVYLCRGVSEGQEVLHRVQSLLDNAGFRLKRKVGPVNLCRRGAWVEILGFRISRGDGGLRYEPGCDAWGHLCRSLSEAHRAPNPTLAAQAAAVGWLDAMGPALESATECDVLERVRREAARLGFREGCQRGVLRERIHRARERWAKARQRALGDAHSYAFSA